MHPIKLTSEQIIAARTRWVESGYLRRDFKTADAYLRFLEGDDGAGEQRPGSGRELVTYQRTTTPADAEARWVAEWARSPRLREQFSSGEAFAAYQLGVESGAIEDRRR